MRLEYWCGGRCGWSAGAGMPPPHTRVVAMVTTPNPPLMADPDIHSHIKLHTHTHAHTIYIGSYELRGRKMCVFIVLQFIAFLLPIQASGRGSWRQDWWCVRRMLIFCFCIIWEGIQSFSIKYMRNAYQIFQILCIRIGNILKKIISEHKNTKLWNKSGYC